MGTVGEIDDFCGCGWLIVGGYWDMSAKPCDSGVRYWARSDAGSRVGTTARVA